MIMQIPMPQPKQREFMLSRTKYTCYGGARGGGKSWALRNKANLMALRYAGIRQLIIRKSLKELRDNHITQLQILTAGIAKYNESKYTLTYANGSVVFFGYFAHERDIEQYQGIEYDIIYIDEATQMQEMSFIMLTASMRGINDYPKRVYLTCNPGGVGHSWVKRLFIDRQFKDSENPDDYTFIQALVQDNAVLMETQPDYVNMLRNLPDSVRDGWLNGNWDSFVGQYYTMWDRQIHVITPFDVPKHWRRYRCIDYGLDMLAVLWVAVDEYGKAYVYKEIHEPNLIVSAAAQRIIEVNGDDEIYNTYAPPDLWSRQKDTGKTMAELFGDGGVYLVQSSNNRVQGWMALAEYLNPYTEPLQDGSEEVKTAKMAIFSNCDNLIKNLPLLQRDEKNPSDCDTEPHEITHICDALRYFSVMHAIKTKPLDTHTGWQKSLQEHKKRMLTPQKNKHRR
jgi:phage terminase large subunit